MSRTKLIKDLLYSIGSVIELPESEMGMGSELVSCIPGFIAAIFNEICISAQKHRDGRSCSNGFKYNDWNGAIND